GGGGKKAGIVIGAVAIVAALGVGAYFVLGSGGGTGGPEDDGPHKLTTPATVLGGEYKKGDAADSGGFDEKDIKNAEKYGVKDAKDVNAGYQAGDESNPLAMKMINFMGVYGDIGDPEKVVDAMFAEMKKNASQDEGTEGEVVGSPKSYQPDGLDGAVLKCQETKVSNSDAESGDAAVGPSEFSVPVCIWGDHSTLGVVIHIELADAMAGKAGDLGKAAELTAEFREDVRVKA
ncbi:membrane protein, partial [Streptomyces caelestis]